MKEIFKKLIDKFAPKVKEEINEFAQEAIEKLKIKVENYDYSVKLNALVEFVMIKIQLPLWLKPFKGVIKNVIKETAEKLIEEVKDKIEEIKVGE